MYYIRKFAGSWAVHNNFTKKKRTLDETEVQQLLLEFPNLQDAFTTSKSVTLFRNTIKSISNLP